MGQKLQIQGEPGMMFLHVRTVDGQASNAGQLFHSVPRQQGMSEYWRLALSDAPCWRLRFLGRFPYQLFQGNVIKTCQIEKMPNPGSFPEGEVGFPGRGPGRFFTILQH